MKIPKGWRRVRSGCYQNEFYTAMVYRVHCPGRLWAIATRERSDRMLVPWIEQQCYHTAGECFRALGLRES